MCSAVDCRTSCSQIFEPSASRPKHTSSSWPRNLREQHRSYSSSKATSLRLCSRSITLARLSLHRPCKRPVREHTQVAEPMDTHSSTKRGAQQHKKTKPRRTRKRRSHRPSTPKQRARATSLPQHKSDKDSKRFRTSRPWSRTSADSSSGSRCPELSPAGCRLHALPEDLHDPFRHGEGPGHSGHHSENNPVLLHHLDPPGSDHGHVSEASGSGEASHLRHHGGEHLPLPIKKSLAFPKVIPRHR